MVGGARGPSRWDRSPVTPRRSARLNSPKTSPRRTLPGGIGLVTPNPTVEAPQSVRRTNVPFWSQSHTADVSRDAAVSSYYLRAQGNDESYDGLSAFGSLLRGSQRPEATPDKSLHTSIFANDSADWENNDYTEEDRFVSQVEESGLENTRQEPSVPPSNDEQESHHIKQPEDIQTEHRPWSILWLLTAVAAAVLAYFVWNNATTHIDEPLIPTHGWSEASLGEVKTRISQLENAVNRVWSSVSSIENENAKVHASLAQRIKSLEDRALPATIKALEHDILELHTSMGDMKRKAEHGKRNLENFADRIAAVEKSRESHYADAKAVSSLEERVTKTQQRIQELVADASKRLQPVKNYLPEHMPVRFDGKSNMLSIDPVFWQELRKVFVTRKESDTSSSSWSDFHGSNVAELDRVLEGRIKNGAILSRDSFLKLLDAEIARAKLELSSRFNENIQGIQNDILDKVRKQREMHEESGSWDTQVKREQVDQDAIQRLIDTALARFAADQIGRADYAQYSAGARVVPSLTSPTHEIEIGTPNFVGMLARFIPLPPLSAMSDSSKTVRGRMPVVALHQDTSPGMCWPFFGSHGQIGIRLVRRIHITAITIDHVSRLLALDGGASAPRDVEAWGILESDLEIQQLQYWRRKRSFARDNSDPMPVPPSPAHVFLGAFTYDAGAGAPAIQTFPVTGEAAAAGISLRTVQISILSNYGLREFTCLYRVRVHGDPIE